MSKKRGEADMSFSQYSGALGEALSADILSTNPELQGPLSQMLGLLALTMTGGGSFSPIEIRIARGGTIYHPSGLDEANVGKATSMTGTDVGSHRVFGRNFNVSGRRHEASDWYPALGDEFWQYRAVESWACDRNGEADQTIATMRRILAAGSTLKGMVRQNFKAIDQKSLAVARLDGDMMKLEETPIHTLSIELAKTTNPIATVTHKGVGSVPVAELMVMHKLNGQTDVVFRGEGGWVDWASTYDWMQSASLLQMLPDKIEAAHKNFGPKNEDW